MFSVLIVSFVLDILVLTESRNRFGFFTEAPAFTPPSIGPATLPPDFQPRISIRGSKENNFVYLLDILNDT
jgi:hypothetical protein